MKAYFVVYADGGVEKTKRYSATSAGQAFCRAIEAHPGATLVRAYLEGGYRDGYGYTEFLPPSMKKPEPLPVEKREQATFEFNGTEKDFESRPTSKAQNATDVIGMAAEPKTKTKTQNYVIN
jgi:hypothetical protein